MEQKQMDESDRGTPSTFWRMVRILALSLVLCFLTLALFHYVYSELKYEGGVDSNPFAIAFLVLALGCVWLLVRQIRTPAGEAPLTRQERLNRNVQIASVVAAFVLVMAMYLGVYGDSVHGGILSNDPLPPAAVILPILLFGVVGPAISLYWHRIIDEQEADAYKSGALVALYVFASGAPVWWLAWRGGFVPPPNGFVIWFVTISVASGIWLWKKYR